MIEFFESITDFFDDLGSVFTSFFNLIPSSLSSFFFFLFGAFVVFIIVDILRDLL